MYEIIYSQITDKLVEDGYIVLENFLDTSLINELQNIAQEELHYKKAGISSAQRLHIDTSKRSDKTRWVEEDNAAQSEYLTFCTGLQQYLNQSLYLGLNYYESHFAIYNAGDFYEKHLDAFRGNKNRVVTTVLYLNKKWEKQDGGELLVYDENNNLCEEVEPTEGKMIVFLSEKFPHEVLKAHKKRYSIAGWFRVDK